MILSKEDLELESFIKDIENCKKLYRLFCKDCKKKFLAPHNSYKLCPTCAIKAITFKCEICEKDFIDDSKDSVRKQTHICQDCLNSLPGKGNYILKCSHIENHINDLYKGFYLAESPNAKDKCPLCFSKSIKCALYDCNNIIENIYIYDNTMHFCCQTHQRKYNAIKRVERNIKPGICLKNNCGKWNEHRDALGFGIECGCSSKNAKNNLGEDIYEKLSELWATDPEYRSKCLTHGIVEYRYCENCNKETLHNGRFCCECNEESLPGPKRLFKKTKEKVLIYNNEAVTDIIQKLNNNIYNIEDFHGWNKRWCKNCNKEEWHYKTECLKCGDINILATRNIKYFNLDDNFNPLYYDIELNKYILWEEYKDKFDNKVKNGNINSLLKEIQKDYPNAYIQPTFRTQESQDWTGARIAFEQNLIDKNIGYFVYFKLYLNPNDNNKFDNLKLLVIGKTGSLLVNTNGTDVNFSEIEKDGPARKFLKENNYQWDKTKIIVIPTESEKEALRIEKEIKIKYKLFSS